MGTLTGKMIPLQLDDGLQAYTEFDDLSLTIDKYSKKYEVDVSVIDYSAYYPWEIEWFFVSGLLRSQSGKPQNR